MATAGATRTLTTTEFVGVVASLGGYPPERARYWTQGVLASLAEVDPQVAEIVPLGELDPEAIVTPGIFVQRVVKEAA